MSRGLTALPVIAVLAVSAWSAGSARAQATAASGAAVRVAEQEVARRQVKMREAEVAIREGDLLYANEMLAESVEQYRSALLSLKTTPMEKALRSVALSKYERAATEYGEKLVKEGRFAEAKKVTDDLLDPALGSEYRKAKRLSTRLGDEAYHNPALTPEHVEKVALVEELLQKGNDAMELGDFDGARMFFAQVLGYDKYSSGARRGLEMVDRLATEYYNAASDHTRAKMLGDIGATWARAVPTETNVADSEFLEIAGIGGVDDGRRKIARKLKTIVFPTVSFNEAQIEDVIGFLTARSRDLDTAEPDPARRGVSIILNLAESANVQPRTISLQLRSVPLEQVLGYVTEQAGLKYKVEEFAVSIVPLTADSGALLTRRFRVRPDFMSSASMGGAKSNAADPFAAPDAGGRSSELAPKLTAREFLESNGVQFSQGAMAQFVSETSTLVVRNTVSNIDLIEALVAGSQSDVPRQVIVTTRIIDTSEERLEELGVSWLMAGFEIGGGPAGVLLGGGTPGNVRPLGVTSGSSTSDFPVGNGLPVSGGLRTGGLAQPGDGIGGAIANSLVSNVTGLAAQGIQLAPAIFGVTGVIGSMNVEAVLRGLSQQKGVDVLAAPSTVVRSGQRAEIKIVREMIYPTEYDPPDIPNTTNGLSFPVTPANPTAFETRELGALLEVEPIIGPDGITVELNIAPEVSDFQGFVNYGSPITVNLPATSFLPGPLYALVTGVNALFIPPAVPPPGATLLQPTLLASPQSTAVLSQNRIVMPIFKTVRTTTTVSCYDGQTVVLGGLLEERKRDVKDKVPIIGDIPIVGKLFRSTSTRSEKRAILLFVSVRIIDPSGHPVNEI